MTALPGQYLYHCSIVLDWSEYSRRRTLDANHELVPDHVREQKSRKYRRRNNEGLQASSVWVFVDGLDGKEVIKVKPTLSM